MPVEAGADLCSASTPYWVNSRWFSLSCVESKLVTPNARVTGAFVLSERLAGHVGYLEFVV